jgi:hypothetical protein
VSLCLHLFACIFLVRAPVTRLLRFHVFGDVDRFHGCQCNLT